MSAVNENARKITEYFASLTQKVRVQVPDVVAETAVEYYKESFSTKSFDGKPWPQVKKAVQRGSLMVRSGALVSSIRPSEISPNRVAIQAGSIKVPYARIHNEGLTVNTIAHVGSYTRRNYKSSQNRRGNIKKTLTGESTVKAHTRKMNYTMPQRQFIGYSAELNRRIITRIETLFKS